MQILYNRDYFENGIATKRSLYTNYRWLPERTIPMCAKLQAQLPIKPGETVLDYGCAKGFVVKALRLLGVKAWGYDVSEYAISCAPEDVAAFVSTTMPPGRFDWTIAKDVLEHVPYGRLEATISAIPSHKLFVVVPLGSRGRYNVEAYERDDTHVIREPLEWWLAKVELAGFSVEWAAYQFDGLKEEWRHAPRGNGFLKGERKGGDHGQTAGQGD
jgi:SAM-dependent methyltransferase